MHASPRTMRMPTHAYAIRPHTRTPMSTSTSPILQVATRRREAAPPPVRGLKSGLRRLLAQNFAAGASAANARSAAQRLRRAIGPSTTSRRLRWQREARQVGSAASATSLLPLTGRDCVCAHAAHGAACVPHHMVATEVTRRAADSTLTQLCLVNLALRLDMSSYTLMCRSSTLI